MKHPQMLIIGLCLLFHNGFGQFQISPDSSFYQFLDSFYVHYQADSAEGGIYNQVRRDKMTWGPRLAPTGNMSRANKAMLDYTRLYSGIYNNSNNLPPVGTTPIVIPPVHPLASDWDELGPNQTIHLGGNGRGMGQIHRLAFHPNYDSVNNQTIYAGSHYGGLYRTDDGGLNWYNYHTDRGLPMTSIGGIAVSSSRVFVCTGNGDHGYSSFGLQANYDPLRGAINNADPIHTQGVYFNHTANDHWVSMNGSAVVMIDGTVKSDLLEVFEPGGTMRNIIVHPTNDQILLIATSQGIFRTQNRGFSWEQVLVGPAATGGGFVLDTEWRGLEFHPTNPDIVYASGRNIYESVDGGQTWTALTGTGASLDFLNTSFPLILPERINVATTPAAPHLLYVYLIRHQAMSLLVYSRNTGNWQHLETRTGLYETGLCKPAWAGISVSPVDSNHVCYGCTVVRGSYAAFSGAFSSWSPYANGAFHADVHSLAFSPNNGSEIFAGTHGGVSKLPLGGSTSDWVSLYDGLGVATIWSFDDWEGNDSLIALAQQDVGTNITIDNGTSWGQMAGEDGYGTRIDDQSGDLFFRQNDGTSFHRLVMSPLSYSPNNTPDGQWLPSDVPSTFPMLNHPKNDSLYFGFTELYLRNAHTRIDSLVAIDTFPATNSLPNGLSSNATNCDAIGASPGVNQIYQWVQPVGSGGLSAPGFCVVRTYQTILDKWGLKSNLKRYQAADDNRRILEIGFSEDENSDYTYLVTLGDNSVNRRSDFYFNNGLGCDTCFVLKNAGLPIDTTAAGSDPNPITGIAVDPLDGKRLWLSFSGYSKDIKVYYSSDSGSTWTSYDDANNALANLNVPINNIVYQRGTKDRLYIATDVGVYVREDGGDWLRYGENFPNVRTTELKINYCLGKLRAATFGRGVWESDLLPAETDISYRSFRTISGTEIWSTDKNMSRDIKVKTGATLILDSITLNMPKGGLIVVETGGILMVNGSTITNLCGQTWQGIQVWGNSAMPQLPSHQGMIGLNGSRIEYAKNAISPWQVGHYPDIIAGTGGTGGLIRAMDSEFVNNWRSIDFMQYRSTTAEQSSLLNCTFTVNDAYRPFNQDSIPFFLGHISMWGIGGTEIKGCSFKDERSNKVGDAARGGSFGLLSLGGSPQLRKWVYLDKRNRFEGLERGLDLTGPSLSPLTATVDECNFIDNEQALTIRAQNHAVIIRDSFVIGGFAAASPNHYVVEEYGLGLIANTAFVVEQNVFQASSTDQTLGSWVEDAGAGGNQIRNNQYHNLTGGNLAHGRNDGVLPDDGMQYLCNQNSSNAYDFTVLPNIMTNAAPASIGAQQGSITQASRNTLSTPIQSLPAQAQFYNYSYNPILGQFNAPIAYYYTDHPLANTSETPDPALLLNVNLQKVLSLGFSNFCADHYTGVGVYKISDAEGSPLNLATLKANYYQTQTAYNILEENYSNLDPADSSLVLEQAGELAGANREVFFWANAVIRAYSNDSLPHEDSIAVWIQKKTGLEAVYELVEHYWRIGQYNTALEWIDSVPAQYSLGERALNNQDDYKRLKQLLYTAYQAGRTEANLEKAEVEVLEEIAATKWGFAAVQAGNILNFFYRKGIIYYPTLPDRSPIEGRYIPATNSKPSFASEEAILEGSPSPAINWVDVSYQLPKGIKKGDLIVTATSGAKVAQFKLQNNLGQLTLNTKNWAAGIYFAVLYSEGQACKVFKIVLQK